MPVIFELKNLTVPKIADNLSLQLKQGMTAFLKTSSEQENRALLQVLTGEILPCSGTILFDGTELTHLDREALLKVRHRIGIITAQGSLISNLKVWENITLPVLYHHETIPTATADQALQLLEELGLKNRLWALPGHLSRAELILVSFVRAVIVSPRLLIYAANLNDLHGQQQETLLRLATQIQHQNNAPATIFIAAEELRLPQLQPDVTYNLKQNSLLATRSS